MNKTSENILLAASLSFRCLRHFKPNEKAGVIELFYQQHLACLKPRSAVYAYL